MLGHVIDITTTGWNWALVIDAISGHLRQATSQKKLDFHDENRLLFARAIRKFHLPILPNAFLFDGPKGPNVEPKPARKFEMEICCESVCLGVSVLTHDSCLNIFVIVCFYLYHCMAIATCHNSPFITSRSWIW